MIKKHPSIPPTHPGEYLREIVLPAMDLSKVEIARALGISRQHLYDILNEKQPVTATTALRLGKFFGTSAKSWLNMQTAYDLEMAARVTDLSAVPVAKSA
ncbi:MAG TPA: addiction module antidote protein, HigA family [Alphaproteobacteria bacterium]|jgi:addiction module HigA family antidote|nr:MAG: addiction module antidote protein, HigA family [Candidatus Puniceispirillum sp. TMED245]HCV88245.1 addiction module antidote protein, HigA family [Alphaproteobacteria bacterium]